MNLLIDTCVLPRCRLEEAKLYRDRYGLQIGFELLPMFDLMAFEADLENNLELFSEGTLFFHEPVWGVEHTGPKGSIEYKESMYHILKTKKFAEILHPSDMVYHLNNDPVFPGKKDEMLRTSLENLEEMHELFPDVRLLVENTGNDADGCKLLDQDEFTDLCRDRKFDVLVDVGHANANSWDVYKLTADLKDQIRGFHLHNNDGVHDLHNRMWNGTVDFDKLLPYLRNTVPDAVWVIEYTRPEYHGMPLLEDIDRVFHI